jgi:DNA helicase-2/ATP-dependent DNA helicase PcrA
VGDPNQAIYGFNGADKTLFDTHPSLSGGAHVISLPSNYRCTPEIVTMAVSALASDGQTADAVSRRANGSPVRLERQADDSKEREFITKAVLRAHGSHRAWSDIAVLTRINAHADAIREDLAKVGIPVRSSRRGGEWGRAVSAATECTGRDELSAFAADILDTGEYSKDDADYVVASYVRDFLDNNRSGMVDGRAFGTWLTTSADVAESDGVEVLSFHAAKGREWSFVVVAGAEKGLLPFSRARTAAAKSEEARLAYVAFTRAADELVITWTDKRNNRSSGPSPLLPSYTTAIPIADAPPEELRRIAARRSTKNPIEEAIDTWRRKQARTARIDPDGVITKRQLKALAFQKPTTVQEIADIIDDSFASRFGEELLAVMGTAAE